MIKEQQNPKKSTGLEAEDSVEKTEALPVFDKFITQEGFTLAKISEGGDNLEYRRLTAYFLADRPINQVIQIKRSFLDKSGSVGLKVSLGVEATAAWRYISSPERIIDETVSLPQKKTKGWAGELQWSEEDLVEVFQVVEPFLADYSESLIAKMQKEYQRGRTFIDELTPQFLTRFSDYNIIIDRYDVTRRVFFVNEEGEYVSYSVSWPNWFSNSLGELIERNDVEDELGDDIHDAEIYEFNFLEYKGEQCFIQAPSAVWQVTRGYSPLNIPGESPKQTELIEESLNALDEWLTQRAQYRLEE